jgi:hypothetical protein
MYMADSSIIKYIKDTLAAGFSEDQVREALAKQGWYKDEIDQAFSEMGAAPKPAPRQAAPKQESEEKIVVRRAHSGGFSGGFLMCIIGGVLIIINSVLVSAGTGDLLGLFISPLSISLLNMFDVSLSSFDMLVINVIIGGFLVGSSYIIFKMPDKAKLTGMFIVALSMISVLIGNGFLIGGIIAILGGLFSILGK